MWLRRVFRAMFVVMISGVAYFYVTSEDVAGGVDRTTNYWAALTTCIVLITLALGVEIFLPKKSFGALAGVFFGLLVGIFISWALSPVVDMINDSNPYLNLDSTILQPIKLMIGMCVCFLVISVVIRTKDDVRFVIPYVEFAKQTKGTRPLILDTSAIIDGRIADLYHKNFFDAPLLVPRFVLNELQLISDSADKLKRNRGRRGLDILNKIQMNPAIDIEIDDTMLPEVEEVEGVDQKLVVFTKHCNGRLATTDYNLSKVAMVRKVDVLNINDLANSLKTVALPGENLIVKIIKAGEEADQGIGYLDDGTMVVVEGGRNKIGRDVSISITSALQTAAGKMIFGKYEGFTQNTNNNRQQPNKRPDRSVSQQSKA